jgi:hypothetical protein
MNGTRKEPNPKLLHTPNDAVEVIGDRKRWEGVKAHVIKVCGPKFGKTVYHVNQLMVCRKVLGRSTPDEVSRFNGFNGKWADDVVVEVAEFRHLVRLGFLIPNFFSRYDTRNSLTFDRPRVLRNS